MNFDLKMIIHPLDYSLLIFDADGTLRRCLIDGQPCPNSSEEWALMPKVRDTLKAYSDRDLAIASNQGGVYRGFLSGDMAWDLLGDLSRAIFPQGPVMRRVMCPHDPRGDCVCRKPSPYLLFKLMDSVQVGRSRVLYVGDLASDAEAAHRAGVDFLWAKDFFGWQEEKSE